MQGATTRWLAIVALMVAACTSPEERLAHHIERGEAFLRNNQIDAALLEFQSALNMQPDNAAIYERVGDVLMEYSQLYPQAISYYREAHRIEPNRLHSIVREARLLALEDPARARELLDTAIALDADAGSVLRAQAYFALIGNDLVGAREAAQRAIEIDPSPPSYAELGAVYLAHIARDIQQKRRPTPEYRDAAIEAYEQVNQLKGGSYHRAILEQARVYGLCHMRRQARTHFREAIELAQAEGAAETQLAAYTTVQYARRVRDRELERHALRTLVTIDEDHYQAWKELADLAERHPNRSGDEILQELTAKRPEDGRAWILWADHLAATDRARQARNDLRRAIDRGITDPALYEALIRLEIQLGSIERARALYEELQRREPDSQVTRIAGARIALVERRPEDAERTLRSMARETPTVELLRLLALAHFRQAQLQEARQVLQQAIVLADEPSVALLRQSAQIEMSMGNWRGAMDAYVGMLKLRTELTPDERVNFAVAAQNTGRNEKAREVLEEMVTVAAPLPEATIAYARFFGGDKPMLALTALRAAHRHAPGNGEVVRAMTLLEVKLGMPQHALDRLTGLVQSRQAGPLVLLTRAELLAGGGAYEQAEADALLAYEANPSLTEAVDLLHTLYRAQGKLESARLAFEEADAAGVLHPGGRLLLARLLAEDGDTEQAEAMLEKLVEEDPELWIATADLAVLLASQGKDLERAFQLARHAHIASKQGAGTSDTLGFVLLKSGKNRAALEQFLRAIEVSRRTGATPPAAFHYHAGLAYQALDLNEKAEQAFRTALAQGEFPQAEDARRQLEAARHQEEEAGSSS